MSQILLTFLLAGALFLFVLVKTGMRLIFPFGIFVVTGAVSMAVFVWASSDPISPDDPFMAINPVSLLAAFGVVMSGFAVMLLPIVVVARWFSGEYSSVKEGHET